MRFLMLLNKSQIKDLYEVAKKAALAAGTVIKSANIKSLNIQKKVGGENPASQIVTEIDLKAQKVILEFLTPTLKRYDLALLAEESIDDGSRFIKDYFWCIDPLDGTLAFTKEEQGYSVSIALVDKDGNSIIGVVYDPIGKNLYHAMKDHPAYRNDSIFKKAKDRNVLTHLYDQSFLKHELYENELNKLNELAKKLNLLGVQPHPLGGAVLNAIYTIEMAPAIYYKHPKKGQGGGSIWDFAASSIIQAQAGGYNSNFYGGPLDLNRKDSSFMNHEGIIFSSEKGIKI